MNYIIVDLEATCWETGGSPNRSEIIEIGAVRMASASEITEDAFAAFVRPIASPELSEFCTQLTSIRQSDVDAAETFPVVFPRFLNWIGDAPYRFCSWGAYDPGQFQLDCTRHAIPYPARFENAINLKKAFSRLYDVKPTGMKGALAMLRIPLDGTHHRGIDDARNIAKLAQRLLPQIEREGSDPR